ncbi:class I SAM-dependent methyltransferase [Terasakiella pusilla]|uniref:class I SAM-dependent methyltransferase n=1 Tax=Terasakiella pusilla TaxID=64973 RepID=UPI003AA8427D
MEAKNSYYKLSDTSQLDFEDGWYDAMHPEHFWLKWRNDVFLKYIHHEDLADKNLKVLDIGAGTAVTRHLIEKSTNWTIDAADLNPAALKNALTGRGDLFLYNIFDLNDDLVGKYDAIILFDVIEHIKEPEAFLEVAAKHLKPNGYIFLNVPALQTFYSIFDEVMGHHRRYNKKNLVEQMDRSNIQTLSCGYWGLSLLPFLVARKVIFDVLKSSSKNNAEIAQDGVTPPNKLMNSIFHIIESIETFCFQKTTLGTSVMLVGRKA